MKLTRAQKISGGVLAAAVVALIWDRASSSPSAVEAGTATSLIVPHDPLGSPAAARPMGADANRAVWTQRLSRLASEICLDTHAPDNAFEPSDAWSRPVPKEPDPPPPTAPSESKIDVELANAFRKHRLDAVMAGRRDYANVDGQGVFIGETIDGFTLLGVTNASAIFGRGSARVELRLANPSTLKHRGSLIENASPAK